MKKKETAINRRTLIDQDTGEVVEATEIVQSREMKDEGFDKVWIGHIMTIIEELGNAKMKVIGWMISNRDRRNNRIIATQQDIANGCGVSRQTVVTTISALKKDNIISKYRNGVYRLNPDLVFYGSPEKRLNILYKYKDETEKKDASAQNLNGSAPKQNQKEKQKEGVR